MAHFCALVDVRSLADQLLEHLHLTVLDCQKEGGVAILERMLEGLWNLGLWKLDEYNCYLK